MLARHYQPMSFTPDQAYSTAPGTHTGQYLWRPQLNVWCLQKLCRLNNNQDRKTNRPSYTFRYLIQLQFDWVFTTELLTSYTYRKMHRHNKYKNMQLKLKEQRHMICQHILNTVCSKYIDTDISYHQLTNWQWWYKLVCCLKCNKTVTVHTQQRPCINTQTASTFMITFSESMYMIKHDTKLNIKYSKTQFMW